MRQTVSKHLEAIANDFSENEGELKQTATLLDNKPEPTSVLIDGRAGKQNCHNMKNIV
jgi:hypothetical protein